MASKDFLAYSKNASASLLLSIAVLQLISILSKVGFYFTYTLGLVCGRKCVICSVDPDADFCAAPEGNPVDEGAIIVADKRGGGGRGGFYKLKHMSI